MTTVTLTDGGMGQELLRRSKTPPTPLWSARVLIDEPDLVRDLHAEFIRAGARVITINAYAATPERLEREGVPELFEPMQKRAIDLAEAARDAVATDDQVLISGCLSPLFGSYHPVLTISFEETLGIYRRIVAEQAERVDFFLCETMASAEEARAAAIAATESGKPVWLSWTLADDGPPRLRSGETHRRSCAGSRMACLWPPASSTAAGPKRWPRPCPTCSRSVGASAPTRMRSPPSKRSSTEARSTCSARATISGPSSTRSSHWAGQQAGAAIVGGCCEVGPEHIAALRDHLHAAGIGTTGAIF